MGKLKDVIEKLFKIRSIPLQLALDSVRTVLQAKYPDYYLQDVYIEPSGSMTLVCTNRGKLYKFPIIQNGSEFTLGEESEVEHTFTTKSTTRQIGIIRQGEQDLWYMISGTAVLNRDKEIDSRLLYDNLIRRANENKAFPFLTLAHTLQPEFRLGQTTFLAREGYAYLQMGTWDDNELAQAVKHSLETDPEYWGASIRFAPIGDPEILRVHDVEIPVYNDGIHVETSILPEAMAASLFTNTQTMEVLRMNKALEESIRKVFGDQKEQADKWINTIDEVNRTIQDEDMIARGKEEKKEEPPAEPPSDTTTQPLPTEDELVKKVIAALETGGYVTKQVESEAVPALVRKMAEFEDKLSDASQDLVTLAEAIEGFSNEEEDKKREQEENSTGRTAKGGTRPRERNLNKDDAPLSLAEIAAQTLEKLESKT